MDLDSSLYMLGHLGAGFAGVNLASMGLFDVNLLTELIGTGTLYTGTVGLIGVAGMQTLVDGCYDKMMAYME